jgi:hypothetical protein
LPRLADASTPLVKAMQGPDAAQHATLAADSIGWIDSNCRAGDGRFS